MARTWAVLEAVVTAVPRSANEFELASNRAMLHFGQTADAAWRSRSISVDQPVSAVGSGVAAPFWLTWAKQGLVDELVRPVSWASVQFGIPGRLMEER